MAPYYHDPVFPWYARNGAFSLIPSGIAFLLLFAGYLVMSRAEAIAIALFGGGFLMVVVAMFLTYEPPEWVKPQWMRNGERWDQPHREHLSAE